MNKRSPPSPPSEHPADLADRLQTLSTEEAAGVLRGLPSTTAARALAELDPEAVPGETNALTVAELQALFAAIPHDKLADLAGELPEPRRREALARLAPTDSAQVQRLLRYPADSAGGIMSDRFIALPLDLSLEQALQRLRQEGGTLPAFGGTYLYAVDTSGRLKGVITIRDLVFRQPTQTIGDILKPDVKFVRAADDQETVARIFAQYHYLALPVLETDGRLVGVVQADQAVKVAQAEATEDMQLMVGLSGEERTYTTWRQAIPRRLPWLLINLATAFLAAAVVALFESTIARWTALAIFLPIIAGQGGNAGMQTLTVIIRGMALGEIAGAAGRKALYKETMLGVLNGLAVGAVVGAIGYGWQGSLLLGVIVCLAMFLNMLAAALSGVLIPFALRALRIDPALASSIFLTTVTDVAGFFFFLGLAALGLSFAQP
jgi:magnesium transporter